MIELSTGEFLYLVGLFLVGLLALKVDKPYGGGHVNLGIIISALLGIIALTMIVMMIVVLVVAL